MRKTVLFFVMLLCGAWAAKTAGEEATHVGVKKCKTCHIKVYQTWKETKHAVAFDTLNEQEKQDPKCIECHTTNKDINRMPKFLISRFGDKAKSRMMQNQARDYRPLKA